MRHSHVLSTQGYAALRLAATDAEALYTDNLRAANDARDSCAITFWTDRLLNLKAATREAFEPTFGSPVLLLEAA